MQKQKDMRWTWVWLLAGLLMSLLLAGCAGEDAPRLIAAQPREAEPIAVYPVEPPPPSPQVIYTAALTLNVRDVAESAEQAISLAGGQGGYLVNSQVWYQDEDRYTLLTLAVPVARFDNLRRDLLRLGDLESEQVSGELVGYGGDAWYTYAQITVYLQPRGFAWPDFSLPDWRPLRTFAQAGEVFLAIFGFLLDLLIWLLVVPGPFLLAGWLMRRYWIRRQKKSARRENS